jgi:carbonic anhydrase/acetyltransferase-like protein (isoleucine patch superfamily)
MNMQTYKIIVVEDDNHPVIGPLTELRGACELRCGAFTLGERIARQLAPLHAEFGSCVRQGVDSVAAQNASNVIMLNAQALFTKETLGKITAQESDATFVSAGRVVAQRLKRAHAGKTSGSLDESRGKSAEVIEIDATVIDFPWQLVNLNGTMIQKDMDLTGLDGLEALRKVFPDVILRNEGNIHCGERCEIGPGVVIDAANYPVRLENAVRLDAGTILRAANGPVWIAEGAIIEAGAIINGPAYVGHGSIVRPGARLNGDVTLGPQCRVGGEISSVIMQGFSNKQHSGYLGSAYIGSWVNLGAATDNSDLKNNYRPIEVNYSGRKVDSGEMHVGAFIGDFCRTAIHTRLNSGTVVGTCCNLFGADFPEKDIPPFIWFGSDGYQEYRLDKAFETIRTVMPRRAQMLSPDLETNLRNLYQETAEIRAEFLKRNRR